MLRPATRIVLVRPRNPLNIGACARAMANFGLSDLVVVDPFEPLWKEARSAPGAEPLLAAARAVGTWHEALKDVSIVLGTSSFHQRPFEQAVIELPNLNRYLQGFSASAPLAVVFGSERSGLSNDELAACHAVLHIPTDPRTPSMNLAQALAVVGYELKRSAWEPAAPAEPVGADMETFVQVLASLGETLDYPPGYTSAARLGRIRKALQATPLKVSTLHFLLSFARRMQKAAVDRV